jgi:hypothetical protein
MNNDRGKPEVSSKSSLKLDKDNDQQKTDDQIDSPSTAPLKTFKKSSSGKKSNIKYLILIFFILVLGTVGVLYITQQQQEAPVPTVPESEPEAAIETWCTLTFSVPTPTPEPTPVPLYPQCTTINLGQMGDEGFEAISNLQSLERRQVVDVACFGNQSVEPGGVAITKMEFRELQKNLCLPGESCPGHQELVLGEVSTFIVNDHIIAGILENYEVKLGAYALQCRICTGVDGVNCQPWDSVITWPDIPIYNPDDPRPSDPVVSICPQENQTEITISALPGVPATIEVSVTAPTGYTDIELRIATADGDVVSYRDADIITLPTIQWSWPELEVNYNDIVSASFYIDVDPETLGSGGTRCGLWKP